MLLEKHAELKWLLWGSLASMAVPGMTAAC
jgi:hypothetical protein